MDALGATAQDSSVCERSSRFASGWVVPVVASLLMPLPPCPALPAVQSWVQQEFAAFFRTLRSAYKWQQLPAENLPATWAELTAACVAAFGRAPDVLLLAPGYEEDRWARAARLGRPPPDLGYHVWVWIDDVHVHKHTGQVNYDNHLTVLSAADVVVAAYAYNLAHFWPQLGNKTRLWLAHAAAPNFLLPANANPQEIILLIGKRQCVSFALL